MISKICGIIAVLLIAITFIGLTGCKKGGADEVAPIYFSYGDIKEINKLSGDQIILNANLNSLRTKEAIKIGIRGKVMSIVNGKDSITILVEGKVDDDTIYDKASVTIPKGTIITENELSKILDISDIIIGQTAEIIFDGEVAESYPVQGKALTVHLK